MNKPLDITRLFFLTFVLMLNSFQLALAADTSSQAQADEPCHMAGQHDGMQPGHEMASNDCCEDVEMPKNDCSEHSCSDHGVVSTVLAVDRAIGPKTLAPSSWAVDFIPHSLIGRLFPAELRPPRYL